MKIRHEFFMLGLLLVSQFSVGESEFKQTCSATVEKCHYAVGQHNKNPEQSLNDSQASVDFDALIDAKRPDKISDSQWQGLKAAIQQQKITSTDGFSDEFGFSVSNYNNSAVIGAPKARDNGISSGAAYVFELENGVWVEKAKLLADDGVANQQFGL